VKFDRSLAKCKQYRSSRIPATQTRRTYSLARYKETLEHAHISTAHPTYNFQIIIDPTTSSKQRSAFSDHHMHNTPNIIQCTATHIMRVSITNAFVLIAAFSTEASAYNCWRNTDDAGRWRDSKSPADRLVELCKQGDGEHCWQAEVGRMCVTGRGNENFCNYVWGWAGREQSWHGDHFLWSDITCDGGIEGTGDDLHIRIL
jgi:hypothetical protein